MLPQYCYFNILGTFARRHCTHSGMQHKRTDSLKFLENQLELFSKLAIGNSLTTVKKRMLSFKCCCHCIKNEQLPNSLRQKFLQALLPLYIDVGINQMSTLFSIDLIHPVVDKRPMTAASILLENKSLDRKTLQGLSAWVRKHVESCCTSESVDLQFLSSVLHLMFYLVAFELLGSSLSHRISTWGIINMLMQLLKINFDAQEITRDILNRGSKYSTDVLCKLRIVGICNLLMNGRTSTAINNLVHDFDTVRMGNYFPSPRVHAHRNQVSSLVSLNDSMAALMTSSIGLQNDDDYMNEHPVDSNAIKEYIRSLKVKDDWTDENIGRLTQALLVMCKQQHGRQQQQVEHSENEDSALLQSGVALIHRLHWFSTEYFNSLRNAYIITTEDSSRLDTNLMQWVSQLKLVSKGCIEDSELGEFVGLVEVLESQLYIGEPSRTPIHKSNRKIMLSSGVLDIFLNIIDVENQPRAALACSYRFLRALAVGCSDVQKTLFDNIFHLLSASPKETIYKFRNTNSGQGMSICEQNDWKLQLAMCLEEVVVSNTDVCLDFTELHCSQLFYFLHDCDVMVVKHFLDLFSAILKPIDGKAPRRKNQDIVINEMKKSNDLLEVIKLGSLKFDVLHKSYISLLAELTRGTNSYAENFVSVQLPISSIFEMLQNERISFEIKAVYFIALYTVYIETKKGIIGSDVDQSVAMHVIESFGHELSSDVDVSVEVIIAFIGSVVEIVGRSPRESIDLKRSSFVEIVRKILEKYSFNLPKKHIATLGIAIAGLKDNHHLPVPSSMIEYVKLAYKRRDESEYDNEGGLNMGRSYHEETKLNKAFQAFVNSLENEYKQSCQFMESGDNDEDLPYDEEFAMIISSTEFGTTKDVYESQTNEDEVEENSNTLLDVLLFQLSGHVDVSDSDVSTADLKKLETVQVSSRTLQLLRAMMIKARDPGDKCSKMQDYISKGIVNIFSLLDSSDEERINQTVRCLNEVLRNGHRPSQAQLLRYFDLSGTGEYFFNLLEDTLMHAIERISEFKSQMRQYEEEEMMFQLFCLRFQLDSNNIERVIGERPQYSMDGEGEFLQNILLLVQNMCEGFHLQMKSFFHHQQNNIHSTDVVSISIAFLKAQLYPIVESEMEVVTQTLDTLEEFSLGLKTNQSVLLNQHIVDSVNVIMNYGMFGKDKDVVLEKVVEMKAGGINVLLSLLEDNTDSTVNVAVEMEKELDTSCVIANMELFYNNGYISEAFGFYKILMRLSDFTKTEWAMEANKKRKLKSLDFFEKKKCSIEILRDDRVHKIHFFNKHEGGLSKGNRTNLVWTVERTSQTDKLLSFIHLTNLMIGDYVHHNHLKRNLLRSLSSWYDTISNPSLHWYSVLLVSIAINTLMLFNWKASFNLFDASAVERKNLTVAFVALGIVHLVVCTFALISMLLRNPPTRILPTKKSYNAFKPMRTRRAFFSIVTIHHLSLVVSSLLGLFYSRYFYCYSFFHIVVENDILLRVMLALTKNGRTLLWVAALMGLIIYVYSFITFAFYRRFLDHEEGYWCDDLFQCVVTTMRFGLMQGGGIGDGLVPELNSWEGNLARVFFDLTFFILITIIGLNVVFGIIVDTFAELRDERYSIQEAIDGECFICGLPAQEFDRNGNGFRFHVSEEHNMWSYVYFILYLFEKDQTHFTNHEHYVQECLKKGNIDFFPVGRALCLKDDPSNNEEEKISEQLQTLIWLIQSQQQHNKK
eukprot:m.216420 g.216420  ORF g.216420 m.216420 type:complete len:1714 (-) comp13804_c0_seq6:90-5231(-)